MLHHHGGPNLGSSLCPLCACLLDLAADLIILTITVEIVKLSPPCSN